MKRLTQIIILFMGIMILNLACKVTETNQPEPNIIPSENPTTAIPKPTFNSGLNTNNMDGAVHPGDDFQMYVNGKWIKETEIPSDKPKYGVLGILRDGSQDHVLKIIKSAAESNSAIGSDEQKVGDLYASYMDMDTRNALGIQPLSAVFNRIESISNYQELAKYFGYAGKMGYDVPTNFFVLADMKKPSINALYTWQGGLGLPDREYYISEEGTNPAIRKAYLKHIEKMLMLADIAAPAEKAQRIFDLETKMAKQQMKKEETRDMVRLYNPVPIDSLQEIMPSFAWNSYLQEIGMPKDISYVVIPQIDYTKSLNGIIHETSLDTWKSYLKWSALNHSASHLSEAIDNQNFDFYGKELSGIPQKRPLWRRAVGNVNSNLGELVGKVYVKNHFPPEAKERMVDLVQNLIKAYEVSIKELDWMSSGTKEQALDKLNKFIYKIGYPDKWKDYNFAIDKKDLYGNLERAAIAEHQREIKKVGQPIDKTEWGMTPQTVNAYYNPLVNEIVFPAAILQPPFFDMSADDAMNYGAIGGVIGHEIGHGFDDQGSTFDGDGVLRNWWTDEDRVEFQKRTKALVDQYNSFEVLDSLYVNGTFTLGENIGDLGGLSIALKAYKMSLNGKEPPVMDGFTGLQRVFLGWAQAWKSKSRAEALRIQVNTDPHSPAKFRVNGVVRNIPEFYEAFDVQPGHKLYLAPEDRVKIW